MILYADTSALVKLFVAEEGSQPTRDLLLEAWTIGTGLLTRAELVAALARGAKRGLLSVMEAHQAREQVEAVWPTWIHISIDESVVSLAEALAWEHNLRGYDSIHLASALTWQKQLRHTVVMATFDLELSAAAQQAGLGAWPE
jgi:predicted nucleic acid-binding protein